MAHLRIVHLVVVVIAAFETLVQASYYLDDTDSSIKYYVGSWGTWPYDGVWDRTKFYNGTMLYCYWAGVTDSTRCTMAIPFHGSGIALYSVKRSKLVFNVSIDGGPPTSYQIDGVLGCCTSTIQPLYNYTVYNVTSLPLDYHTLLLTSLDPYMWFDYAFVDSPDNLKPTASTSDIHPSITNSLAKSKSRSVIGPAIGGAVGGILVITIAILILFWKRRQTRRGDARLTDPDANTLVSTADRRPVVGASYHPSSIIDPDPNIEVDRIPIVYPSSNLSPSVQNITSPNLVESPPSSTVPSTLPLPVSTLLPSANRIPEVSDTILTAPGPDPSLTSDGALAVQEARFLRQLYDRNVPAEEITELIQAMHMRAGGRAPAGLAVSGGNAEHPDITPPAYNFQN